MPRDIPVGNGQLLVAFDARYQIREIYFPFVGKENHAGGHVFRWGVFAEGRMAWMDSGWDLTLRYDDETLVTNVRARHDELDLELSCADAVDFYANVYVRRVVVLNKRAEARTVKLVWHHNFYISESEIGDTAFYDPDTEAVIHYKGPRYFLVCCGRPGEWGVREFACGRRDEHDGRGTWADAEDGQLNDHPIAQGSVDSTIALPLEIAPSGSAKALYWIVAGHKYQEVARLHEMVRKKTPSELLNRTRNYWRLWANKEELDFADLPAPLATLAKQCQLILRTQIDNGGAIIAANDSDIQHFSRDTYSYVWPRDGALVADALIKAGHSNVARRFFRFCNSVIHRDGYFLHKYNPDGSLASSWHPWIVDGQARLPIQEDQTALVIWALWKHFDRFRDIEFIQPMYRSLITHPADFLLRHRDEQTHLPLPSFDLWEERWGIHTWTVCAVVAGLLAASKFATAFGELELAEKYYTASEKMKQALLDHLYNPQEKCFARMGVPKDAARGPAAGLELDMTPDASLAGTFLFHTFEADEEVVRTTMERVEEKLTVRTDVGGVARYENDWYHRVEDQGKELPGNPWFICTLWIAQYKIARASCVDDLRDALPYLEWARRHALPSGVMPEQLNPFTGEPISVSPLTWSHATYVTAVINYLIKRQRILEDAGQMASVHRPTRFRHRTEEPHSWTLAYDIPEEPEQA